MNPALTSSDIESVRDFIHSPGWQFVKGYLLELIEWYKICLINCPEDKISFYRNRASSLLYILNIVNDIAHGKMIVNETKDDGYT